MSFWEWLFGKSKTVDVVMPRESPRVAPPRVTTPNTPSTPNAPPAAPSSVPSLEAPQMTNIRMPMPSTVRPVFSIQTAIELMRSLPIDENPDLVLRVLRKTLKSTGVEVEEVIKSARSQEEAILGGVATDRAAIELLEQQIVVRKANITRLETELEETREVRARLQEALSTETKVGPVIPPEELLKIQAEAKKKEAAAAAAKAVAPPLKRSMPPKVPLPSGGSKPPKPLTPPPPKAEDSSSSKPTPVPPSSSPSTPDAPKGPDPIRNLASSIPDLGEIDDAFSTEPTEKREVPSIAPRANGEDRS